MGIKFVNDCTIDTDLELLFPDEYITSISERMLLYRELDNMETERIITTLPKESYRSLRTNPKSSEELLNVVRLRWVAISISIERIILKEKKLICYLPSDPGSRFYKSETFQKLMSWILKNSSLGKVKESKGKLSILFPDITSIKQGLSFLKNISEKVNQTGTLADDPARK